MGAENNIMNRYLTDKRRFADLISVVYYQGKQIVDPDKLTEISGTTYEVLEKPEKGKRPKRRERRNDIAMQYADGRVFRIYLTENQEYVNYVLPIRDMEYLSAGYKKQIDQIKKQHEAAGGFSTFAEKASGISKQDRLKPIYLMWLYHGEENWDGPRTLKDIMDFGDADVVESGFSDYSPRLVCINEIKGFEDYQTELRELFQILGYRKNKKGLQQMLETDERLQHMDEETIEAVSVLLHAPAIWKNRKKYMSMNDDKEEYNMCQALREWEEDIRGEFAEKLEKTEEELKKAREEAEKAKEESEKAKREARAYLTLLKKYGIDRKNN